VTLWGSRETWYWCHGLISLWHFQCLHMGKIDVITFKYVIIMTY
jgi:hypothetical protein